MLQKAWCDTTKSAYEELPPTQFVVTSNVQSNPAHKVLMHDVSALHRNIIIVNVYVPEKRKYQVSVAVKVFPNTEKYLKKWRVKQM